MKQICFWAFILTHLSLFATYEGVKTISKQSEHYPTIQAAVDSISYYTITGPLIFNIEPGLYNEQFEIAEIEELNKDTVIVFQSADMNAESVRIEFPSSSYSTNNHTIFLNGADYIQFKHLTIRRTGDQSRSQVVSISNQSKYIVFDHCIIEGRSVLNNTSTVSSVINSDSYSNTGTQITNCIIKGGYAGIYFSGFANQYGAKENLTIISNNTIDGYSQYGIFLSNQAHLTVSGNSIGADISISGGYATTGLYIRGLYYDGLITNNTIVNNEYAVWFQDFEGKKTDRIEVYNNMFSSKSTDVAYSGHMLKTLSYTNVFHNSFYSQSEKPGLIISQSKDLVFYNNISANYGSGVALNVDPNTQFIESDYNNYFSKGATTLDWNDKTTLPEIHSLEYEIHSIIGDPQFFSADDLHANSSLIDGKGRSRYHDYYDIDGELREKSKPDIGADEFTYNNSSLNISNLKSSISFIGEQTISIDVKNVGNEDLENFRLVWSINGVVQPSVLIRELIIPQESIIVELGTVIEAPCKQLVIEAWVYASSIQSNRTNLTTTSPLSGGIYTVGSTGDFQTISEAVQSIAQCGIAGAVEIQIEPGVYEEQIAIPEIKGASASNTLTIQSSTGKSDDVLLTWPSTADVQKNYTLALDGCDYVTIKNISITRSGSEMYGQVVQVGNGANWNIIEGNNIVGILNRLNSIRYSTIAFSEGDNDSNNTIQDNTILNGSYGIYINGHTSSVESGNVITGNTIKQFYNDGIRLEETDRATVTGNIIESDIGNRNYKYGIYCHYVTGESEISRNKILITDTSDFTNTYENVCGIFMNFTTSNATPCIVANNMVSVYGLGHAQGIDFNYCENVDIIHNSVLTRGGDDFCYPLWASNTTNSRVKANAFATQTASPAIYVVNTVTDNVFDYNVYYTEGTTLANWKYNTLENLTELQAQNGMDEHSVEGNPSFISHNNLHSFSTLLNGKAEKGLLQVDFDGETRTDYPDIGADEFRLWSSNVSLVSARLDNSPCMGETTTIKAVIQNSGSQTLTSADVSVKVNNGSTQTIEFSGSLSANEKTTIAITGISLSETNNEIAIWVANPNETADPDTQSDQIVLKDIKPGFNSQIITIGQSGADYQTIQSALDDLSIFGICGTVRLQLENGIYDEHLTVKEFSTISESDKVIIESASGNAEDVIITSSAPTTTPALKFLSAQNVTFQNISFKYDYEFVYQPEECAISFDSICTNISFEHVDLQAGESGVLFQSNVYSLDGFSISNSKISNTKEAFNFVGTNDNYLNNIAIQNCRIEAESMYFDYINSLSFTGNNVTYIRDLQTSVRSPLRFKAVKGLIIERNQLLTQKDVTNPLIYMNGCSGTIAQPISIANNMIASANADMQKLVYIYSSDTINFVHNTLFMDSIPTNRLLADISYSDYLQIVNNSFSTSGNNQLVSIRTCDITALDYNQYFTPHTQFGYYNSNVADFTAWQTKSNADANSVHEAVVFAGKTNLHIINSDVLNNTGTALPDYLYDIDGDLRSNTPDIGADEFEPISLDVGISEPVTNKNYCAGNSIPIWVTVTNYGTETISSFTTDLRVNETTIGIETHNVTLLAGESIDVKAGEADLLGFGANTIEASVLSPNSTADGTETNNLVEFPINTQLSGTYTIGSGGDFETLAQAISAIDEKKTCDNITLAFKDGEHEAKVIMRDLATLEHSLHITSESQDSSKVQIVSPSDYGNRHYMFYISNSPNLSFSHLSIKADAGNSGYGIFHITNSDNISISNCALQIYNENHSGHHHFYISEATDTAYISIKNNQCTGGNYGVSLAGRSNSYYSFLSIEDNRFRDMYTGVSASYLSYLDIRNNYFELLQPEINSVTGITAGSIYGHSTIIGNTILLEALQINTGVYIAAGDSTLIANNYINSISSHNYDAIANTGIVRSNATTSFIVNNTITFTSGTYKQVGILIAKANTSVLNNIIASFEGGAPLKFTSSGSFAECDYNLYYHPYDVFGYNSSNTEISYADHQANGFDTNSLITDPRFLTKTNPTPSNPKVNNAGLSLPYITTDIYETTRGGTPDIGAVEGHFVQKQYDLASISAKQDYCSGNDDIVVQVENLGTDDITEFTIYVQLDDGSIIDHTESQVLASGEVRDVTVGTASFETNVSTSIKAWTVVAENDENPYNDTLLSKIATVGMSGIYTVGEGKHFENLQLALDAISANGTCDAVTLEIVPGYYSGPYSGTDIKGYSVDKPITITSQSGTAIGTSFSRQLSLEDAQYVSITNIGFSNIQYSEHCLNIQGDYITIDSCRFYGISSTKHAVRCNGSNNLIKTNYISAKNGIHIGDDYSDYTYNNSILYNTIVDKNETINYQAIKASYQGGLSIQGNHMNSDMYLWRNLSPLIVNANKLDSTDIIVSRINYMHSTSEKAIFSNNIINKGRFNFDDADNAWVVHNTVRSIGTDVNRFSSCSDLHLLANIFESEDLAFSSYMTVPDSIEYNAFYTTADKLIADGSLSRKTFDEYKAENPSLNNNVYLGNPYLTEKEVLVPLAPELDDYAPLTFITKDFYGNTRSANTDAGAVEFSSYSVDASIGTLVTDSIKDGTSPIYVSLQNNGYTNLTSITINWSINGDVQNPLSWTGDMAIDSITSPILLGNYTFSEQTDYTFQVWTSSPNGGSDNNTTNDIFELENFHVLLAGIYSVGTNSSDFKTLEDACAELEKTGVGSSIVFEIESGEYEFNYALDHLYMIDSAFTITFKSKENAQSVILQHSAEELYNHIFKLQYLHNIHFDNLSFKALGENFGGIIDMDKCSNMSFTNCNFYGKEDIIFNAVSKYNDHLLFDMDNCTEVDITNCQFFDGGKGIDVQGVYESYPEHIIKSKRINIKDCRFIEQVIAPVRLSKVESPEISGNDIITAADSRLKYIGAVGGSALSQSACETPRVINNYINTSYLTGINLGTGVSAGTKGIVGNNAIKIAAGSASGISSSSAYSDINHNTILHKGTGYALALNGSSTRAESNILQCEGGGIPFYSERYYEVRYDYHNLYTPGEYIGFLWNYGHHANLADWKDFNEFKGNEQNSISEKVNFIDERLHISENSPVINKGNGGVYKDIDGDDRTSPDMGADEYSPRSVPMLDLALVSSSQPELCGGSIQDLTITVKNNSSQTVSAFFVEYLAGDFYARAYVQEPISAGGTLSAHSLVNQVFPKAPQGYDWKIWVSAPDLFFDTNNTNDTLFGSLLVEKQAKTITICEGDSYEFNGVLLTETGIYTDTIHTAYGCDSLYAIDLQVVQPNEVFGTQTLAPGTEIFVGGAMQNSPGVYTDVYANQYGCDSIVHTELLAPLPNEVEQVINLSEGWNLISIAVDVANNDLVDIFGNDYASIVSIKSTDVFYNRGYAPYFNSLKKLEAGHAYLIKTDADIELSVWGLPMEVKPVTLERGIHLLGNPYTTEQTIESILGSEANNVTWIKDFDNYYIPGGGNLQSIQSGEGYYIKVLNTITIYNP